MWDTNVDGVTNTEPTQDSIIEDLFYGMRERELGLQLTQKRVKLKTIKNCFTGSDLVNWVVNNTRLPKHVAEQIGQTLLDKLLIRRAEDEHDKDFEYIFTNDNSLYRFQEDEDPNILNCMRIYSGFLRSPYEILKDIIDDLQRCYELYIHSDDISKPIDYDTLTKTREFKRFVHDTVLLQMIKPETFRAEKERVAFFLNVYKILILHSNLERDRPRNRHDVFSKPRGVYKHSYLIGGYKYSISDIEHGILRANRKGAFGKSDPRRGLVPSSFDPRIHFLIINYNCDSAGIDFRHPLKFYDQKNILPLMEQATELFLNNDDWLKVQLHKKLIVLPKLFRDFRSDFGKDQNEVLHWISKYAAPKKKSDIQSMLEMPPGTIQIQYSGDEGGLPPQVDDNENNQDHENSNDVEVSREENFVGSGGSSQHIGESETGNGEFSTRASIDSVNDSESQPGSTPPSPPRSRPGSVSANSPHLWHAMMNGRSRSNSPTVSGTSPETDDENRTRGGTLFSSMDATWKKSNSAKGSPRTPVTKGIFGSRSTTPNQQQQQDVTSSGGSNPASPNSSLKNFHALSAEMLEQLENEAKEDVHTEEEKESKSEVAAKLERTPSSADMRTKMMGFFKKSGDRPSKQ